MFRTLQMKSNWPRKKYLGGKKQVSPDCWWISLSVTVSLLQQILFISFLWEHCGGIGRHFITTASILVQMIHFLCLKRILKWITGKYRRKEGKPSITMIRLQKKNRSNLFLSVHISFCEYLQKPKPNQPNKKRPHHKCLRYFLLLSLQNLVLKSYLGQNHLVIETTLLQGTKHPGNANTTCLE